MTGDSLIVQSAAYLSSMTASSGDLKSLVTAAEQAIHTHFGTNGVIAAYVLTGALGIAVLNKMIKLALSAVIYLVIPALALAWLGSLVLPYSFAALLPFTTGGCSLFFLFKS